MFPAGLPSRGGSMICVRNGGDLSFFSLCHIMSLAARQVCDDGVYNSEKGGADTCF